VSGETERRLRVNPTLCTGFAYCAEIVPERISLDDWGYPIVDSTSIDDDKILQHSRRAVAACPRLALLIEEKAKIPR
jgi:ferredoxin